jgi:hypothetical protein
MSRSLLTPVQRTRLLVWLVIGLAFYAASLTIGFNDPLGHYNQLQQGLWKYGHVTTGSWCAYWISLGALGRLDRTTPSIGLVIARAILMAGLVLALANGL